MGGPNGFSGCSVPALWRGSPPHSIKIVVEVVHPTTNTCLKTVVDGKQRHAPCKICSLQQRLMFVSLDFHGDL